MDFNVLILVIIVVVGANSTYIIGNQGQNCYDACYDQGMNCNPHVVTNNSIEIFQQLGINCTLDPTPWWAEDQPCFDNDPNDPNYGKCVGVISVPGGTQCSGRFPASSRLCNCDPPSTSDRFFSMAIAGGTVTPEETSYFTHYLAPGDVGVLTHFWITYVASTDNGITVRYYIDGETDASIVFTPSLASGVGFYDAQAPWGNEWFGKGSNNGGWFNNFRIPFQKSIRLTIQHADSSQIFWSIARGATNIPIMVGGVTLPSNAKMNMIVTNGTFQPIEWVPLVNISSGPGVFWMHSLSVYAQNMNFLEGCYHAYPNGNTEFPGTLLSSGTEDYFDSAWYFDAGEFHLPVSGFTHYNPSNGVQWSGYRFHDQDPLFFNDGFQFVWRNGDMLDPSGIKCMCEDEGSIVGSPSAADVIAYAWVYTW